MSQLAEGRWRSLCYNSFTMVYSFNGIWDLILVDLGLGLVMSWMRIGLR
jgi:hypothetical protein